MVKILQNIEGLTAFAASVSHGLAGGNPISRKWNPLKLKIIVKLF